MGQEYLQSEDIITRADQMEAALKEKDSGIAPDFTYPDVTGKQVSLSDFRGKVVLIDVWATWCGPCNAEIPKLKELEKKLEGRNICFVSISCCRE